MAFVRRAALAAILSGGAIASAAPLRSHTPSVTTPSAPPRTSLRFGGEADLVSIEPWQALGKQTLYLNHKGATFTQGTAEDSTINTLTPIQFASSGPIYQPAGTIPAYEKGDAAW